MFIPTYNDRELIGELCEQVLCLGEGYSVLVVDDGSEPPIQLDRRIARLYLYRVPYNAGLGCATDIALDFASNHDFDVLARIDADGQHPVAALPDLVLPILSGQADVAIGNRLNNMAVHSASSLLAALLKKHVRLLANAVTGLRIDDWHSGLMAFSPRAVAVLRTHQYERFPEVEVLSRASVAGLRVKQIPILQRERSFGKSSLTLVPVIRHILRVYLILIRHFITGRKNG